MNQRDKVVVKKILNEIKEIEAFVSGLDEAAFLRQKLHHNPIIIPKYPCVFMPDYYL